MSTIIQLTQGSQEWLDYRRSMRNASETAAVLGLSPWCTPYQLWLQKTGRSIQAATAAIQHGTQLEPVARAAYEAQTGHIMQPLVLQDGPYSASLDGITLQGDLIVEIKCPYKGKDSALWRDAANGVVPEHYRLQVQHQLMVSGAGVAHFYVFDGHNGLLMALQPDESVMARITEGWNDFQKYLDADTPPQLTDGDTLVRDDADWFAAAKAFAAAKQASDAAESALTKAKETLVALTQHPREQGAGVAVTKFWKSGNVDYKRIPALEGTDLESYRAKSRQEVRITSL